MKKKSIKNTHNQMKLLARSCGLLALGGAVVPGLALAQQANPGGAVVTGDQKLEEVTVTARRREESLARVPISITAIGSEEILERSIRTDSDLQAAGDLWLLMALFFT